MTKYEVALTSSPAASETLRHSGIRPSFVLRPASSVIDPVRARRTRTTETAFTYADRS
jgi:hypothetical protein